MITDNGAGPTSRTILALSIPDAAAAVSVSRDVLQLAIKRGELIAHYPNSKPLIRLVDLEAWLDSLPTEKPAKPSQV